MPLTLTISLSRKVGEANYGSRGATVGLELETEASLVQRPAEFQQWAARLFRLARESVDRELARPRQAANNGAAANGRASINSRATRPATANQLRALQAIAAERELDLPAELQDRFGVSRAEELSLSQASALITEWRSLVRDQGPKGQSTSVVEDGQSQVFDG